MRQKGEKTNYNNKEELKNKTENRKTKEIILTKKITSWDKDKHDSAKQRLRAHNAVAEC